MIGGQARDLGLRLVEVAIEVPFQVVDLMLIEHCQQMPQHMVEGFRVGQVDNLLLACFARPVRHRAEDPFGMRSCSLRIHVDHLGFNPEPELHPLSMHGVHQWMKTVRPHVRRNDPVAQSGGVIAA